jgi:histone-binding protein RBBP4
MTHALEWPSLTCQWLPTVKNAGSTASEHSMLLGTHTTGEQNYLMVASCNLPKDDVVIDNRTNSRENNDSKENGAAAATTATATTAGAPAAAYDEERKEIGGFGHPSSNIGKIEIRMKIQHKGEVNRARYMPQNHFFVATRGPDPEIYVFDLSKHPSFPEEGSTFSPQVICCGHAKEGYGLSWSKLKQGYLLSGSEDTQLCLWDIMAGSADNNNSSSSSSSSSSSQKIKPLSTFTGHTNVVEDVDWHAKDPNMMASVSDDQSCRIWDVRETQKAAHVIAKAHDDDVNCVSFNPINEYIFATGSADKTVAVWDIRNLKR